MMGFMVRLFLMILVIIAACVAFNYAEPLASKWIGDNPDAWVQKVGPLGVCFMGLFAVTLLVMRLITDKLVSSSMLFGFWFEKIGATIVGIFTGLLVAGVVAVGFQMLYLPASIWGYDRLGYARPRDDRDFGKRSSVFPYGDELLVGLFGYLSEGSFSGDQSFRYVHPAYLDELCGIRAGVQAESLKYAPPGSITVEQAWRIDPNNIIVDEQHRPGPDETFLAVRIAISEDARDTDGHLRFTRTQLQLVGTERQRPVYLWPAGLIDIGNRFEPLPYPYTVYEPEKQEVLESIYAERKQFDETLYAGIIDSFTHAGESRQSANRWLKYEFLFRVPRDFEPHFVQFKAFARADVAGKLRAKPPTQLVGIRMPEWVKSEGQAEIAPPADRDRVPYYATLARVDARLPFDLQSPKDEGQLLLNSADPTLCSVTLQKSYARGEAFLRQAHILGRTKRLAFREAAPVFVKEFARPGSMQVVRIELKLTEQAAKAKITEPTLRLYSGTILKPRGTYIIYKQHNITEYAELIYDANRPVKLTDLVSLRDVSKNTQTVKRFGLIYLVPKNEIVASIEQQNRTGFQRINLEAR